MSRTVAFFLTLGSGAILAAQDPEFLYVANSSSNNIAGFRLDAASGALTPLPGSPFPNGGPGAVSLAVDQNGRFLYSASQSGPASILGFRIEAGGRLTRLAGSPFTAGSGPISIAVDLAGPFAYVANSGSNNVSAFRIEPFTGRLVPLSGSPYPAGSQPSFVTVDPLGKFVYVTNALSNNVSGYSINSATGALTPMSASPFAAGTFPQSIAVDPLSHFAYVANQGSDNISGYAIDAASGALTPVTGSPFAAGAGGVLGVTVDPAALHVYAAGYLGIYGFAIAPAYNSPTTGPGSLIPMIGSPFGTGTNVAYGAWTPNSLAFDYTGAFAYASNGPYGPGNVTGFTANSTSGALTQFSGAPFPTGAGSVSIAVVRPPTTPVYTATQIPNPNFLPVQTIHAFAINNKAEVSGSVVYQPEGSEQFASGFLYSGGVTIALANTRSSSAYGLNDRTEVVGQTFLLPPYEGRPPAQAFLYSNGVVTNLDGVSGRQSAAIGINNAGQVTGTLSTGVCPGGDPFVTCNLGATHAFLYNGGGLLDLGTLGGDFSAGSAINNRAEITGGSNLTAGGPSHLFLYRRGTMHDLGTIRGQSTAGAALNDEGEIAGSAPVGFLYRDGHFHILPLVPGGTYNAPAGINNCGVIVGACDFAAGPTHACLYADGELADLNSLVEPSLTLLTAASGVNDRGQIVAAGLNGQLYILTPKH